MLRLLFWWGVIICFLLTTSDPELCCGCAVCCYCWAIPFNKKPSYKVPAFLFFAVSILAVLGYTHPRSVDRLSNKWGKFYHALINPNIKKRTKSRSPSSKRDEIRHMDVKKAANKHNPTKPN